MNGLHSSSTKKLWGIRDAFTIHLCLLWWYLHKMCMNWLYLIPENVQFLIYWTNYRLLESLPFYLFLNFQSYSHCFYRITFYVYETYINGLIQYIYSYDWFLSIKIIVCVQFFYIVLYSYSLVFSLLCNIVWICNHA